MTKIFIDTDVFIDFLAGRKPWSDHAARLFTRIERMEIDAYTSSLTIRNLYDALREHAAHDRVVRALTDLTGMIGILPVDLEIIEKALQSDFPGLDTAIQYYCAEAEKVNAIISRNIRDYRISEIPVVGPEGI